MKKIKLLLVLAIGLIVQITHAQTIPFTRVPINNAIGTDNFPLPDASYVDIADANNDGYLDMIYGGTQANGTGTVNIYKISKDTTIKTVPNYTFKVTTLPNNLAQLISANDPQNIQFAFGDLNKDKTFDLITTY